MNLDESEVALPPALAARVPYATLPKRYEDAKNALALCNQIDECKAWQDRVAAIASYARQSKDYSLERMAQRIRARALARMGELLKSMPDSVDRSKLLRENGIDRRVGDRAVSIARIPARKREQLIEKNPPATITELERFGRSRSYRPAAGVTLGRFAAWCKANPVNEVAFEPNDVARMLADLNEARAWLHRLEALLGGRK